MLGAMLLLAALVVIALLGVIAFYSASIDARLRGLVRIASAASDLNVEGHAATERVLRRIEDDKQA